MQRVYFHELEVGKLYRTREGNTEETVQVVALHADTVEYEVLGRRSNGQQWSNVEITRGYDFESGVNGDHAFYELVDETPRLRSRNRNRRRHILTRRYHNNMGVGHSLSLYARRRSQHRRPLTRRRIGQLPSLPVSR